MGTDLSKIEFQLSATDRASAVFKTTETNLGRLGSAFDTMVGGLGAGISAGSVTALFAEILSKASEAEQAANRLTAVARNTGRVSREELEGIASAMSASTKFDETSIRKAEAEILIFGNITGKTFEDVLKISADVASFMHTDLPSAAHDVAKAIAEPETAFKLLKSAGVILTDQQKDQIKHMGALGDIAGQQAIILEKLKTGFGGVADAMNTGLKGSTDDLTKSWSNLLEAMGKSSIVNVTAQNFLSGWGLIFKELNHLIGDVGVDGFQSKPSVIKQIIGAPLLGQTSETGTPNEAYAIEKIARQTAAARAAITLGITRDALSAEQKLLNDQHSEGLVALDDYYAARRDIVEKGLIAEYAAVSKGIAAQDAIKANATTPEAIAGADIAIAGLQAQGGKAIRGANTENLLLTAQKRREELAVNEAAAKVLGETYTQAGNRISESEQALADFNETMSLGSQDLQLQTDLLGKSAYEQGLLTQNRNLDLQTQKSAKNINAENVGEMEALYLAAARAKLELKDLYDVNFAATRSFQTGLKDSINQYVDEATNAAAQTKRVFTDGFQGSEDALIHFVKTGKVEVRDLADSIVTDLLRIQLQKNITVPLAQNLPGLAGLIGNFFGPSTQAPAPVSDAIPSFDVGTSYVPRDMLAMVHKGERIVPAAQNRNSGAANGSITITQNMTFGSDVDRSTLLTWGEQVKRATIAAVADQAQRGGSYAAAIRGR